MSDRHLEHWPPRLAAAPDAAADQPLLQRRGVGGALSRQAVHRLLRHAVTFAEFKDEAERIAGFLQQRCGVKAGDRVLLYMQNSPQWVLAFYGILRANAVVVPVNPMNLTDELRHYVDDSGATTAFVRAGAVCRRCSRCWQRRRAGLAAPHRRHLQRLPAAADRPAACPTSSPRRARRSTDRASRRGASARARPAPARSPPGPTTCA